MKSTKLTESIKQVLDPELANLTMTNLGTGEVIKVQDFLGQHDSGIDRCIKLVQESAEFSKIQSLIERYRSTLDVFHRHDESVAHQIELIVQGILKRESGQEHWESMTVSFDIVKTLLNS